MATFPTSNLTPGTTSDAVKQLQEWLISSGYGNIITAGATGYYGSQTQAAVTQWQKDNGVTPASTADYGYWGPLSIQKASQLGQASQTLAQGNVLGQQSSQITNVPYTPTSTGTAPVTSFTTPGSSYPTYSVTDQQIIDLYKNTWGSYEPMDLVKFKQYLAANSLPLTAQTLSSFISKPLPAPQQPAPIQAPQGPTGPAAPPAAPTQGATGPATPTDPMDAYKSGGLQGFSQALAGATGPVQPQGPIYTPYDLLDTNKSLVKFSYDPNGPAVAGDQNTYWLLDKNSQTVAPFVSPSALQDYFQDHLSEALQSVSVINPADLQPGGQYSNYTLLSDKYGWYPGAVHTDPAFTPSSIRNLYGKTENTETTDAATLAVSGFLAFLEKNLSGSGISQDTINSIKSDPLTLAAYVGALGYGGYTVGDILRDMIGQEKAKTDPTFQKMQGIDTNMIRSDYAKSDNGYQAITTLSSFVPGQIGSLLKTQFESTLAQLPNEFYKAIYPSYFDIDSPEFKAEMDKVTSTLHDAILANINATTDAQKQVANYTFQQIKNDLNYKYGLSLSDNALQAWNDLQAIIGSMESRGLSGTGISQEEQDRALALKREANTRLREQLRRETENQTQSYFQKSASPEEIEKMNQEDIAAGKPREQWRSVQWGLAPAVAMTWANYLSDFKSKNPNIGTTMTDNEIKQKFYDPYYDQYGNFRSEAYKTQASNTFQTLYGYNPSSLPSGVESSLKGYQASTVLNKALEQIRKDEAWKDTANTATPITPGSQQLPSSLTSPTPNSVTITPNATVGNQTGTSGSTPYNKDNFYPTPVKLTGPGTYSGPGGTYVPY